LRIADFSDPSRQLQRSHPKKHLDGVFGAERRSAMADGRW
jgi:hypothetical protein